MGQKRRGRSLLLKEIGAAAIPQSPENLFIGMLHTIQRMGSPEHMLTDNVKSEITGRDSDRKTV